MSARQSQLGRQPVSYMLAAGTIARLTRLANASGLSRGRIIDMAIGNVTECRQCKGEGHEDGDPGEPCVRCEGERLEPTA